MGEASPAERMSIQGAIIRARMELGWGKKM